jgi:hypothetical protein
MECRLAGEPEVLGGNLPQRHFCPSQNPTLPDPDLNPGRRGGKPATNRLSYGAALLSQLVTRIVERSRKRYLDCCIQFLDIPAINGYNADYSGRAV